MNKHEMAAELKSWGDRWGQWIGPKGDEARYKRMAECAYAGAEALLAAAEAREDGERFHTWGLKPELIPHAVCLVCGIVARKDGKNSPCKGPASIGLREATETGDWFDWPPPPKVNEVIAWRVDAGVFPAQVGVVYEGDGERDWFTHGGRESLHGDLPTKWTAYPVPPGKAARPTAAAVIAAAEKALEEAEDQLVALCSRGDVPASVTDTLALIASYKEAHGETTAR